MRKAETLDHWRGLTPTKTPAQTMRRVAYKHEGSTFDQDGIRLTGSAEFIDSVLAVLKPLLARENASERLQLSYTESTDRETRRPLGTYQCYIQVHERGDEAKMMNQVLVAHGYKGDF